jgi:hypothetical protein
MLFVVSVLGVRSSRFFEQEDGVGIFLRAKHRLKRAWNRITRTNSYINIRIRKKRQPDKK